MAGDEGCNHARLSPLAFKSTLEVCSLEGKMEGLPGSISYAKKMDRPIHNYLWSCAFDRPRLLDKNYRPVLTHVWSCASDRKHWGLAGTD
eukprot:1158955-Pelagomonas_calceolata.AAC.17